MHRPTNPGETRQSPAEPRRDLDEERGKSEFEYKHHSLIDKDYQFIRGFYTTTTSVHDSQIDLSQKGEIVSPDKGNFGTVTFASTDKTLNRAVRGENSSGSTNGETGSSAVSVPSWNGHLPGSCGCFTMALC